MTLNHYAAFLFKLNEHAVTKMTDEEILAKINDEFKEYFGFKTKLIRLRQKYNLGILNGVPLSPSFRYSKEGLALSPNGRLLSSEAIKYKLLSHESLKHANIKG